jgi:hypothetical protein
MSKHNAVELSGRETSRDELTELIRDGARNSLTCSASQPHSIDRLAERLDSFWEQTFKSWISRTLNGSSWPFLAAQTMKFIRGHPTATCDPSWSVATSSPNVRYQQKRPLSSRQLTGTSGQFWALN